MTRSSFLLALVALASLLPYLAALGLGDLRRNTLGFEVAFFAAFLLYLAAVVLVIRNVAKHPFGIWPLGFGIFFFALLFRLILLASRPTLSDDMYRYVWDGRVQAHGFSPYRYPPNAPELADLRQGDRTVWRYINRKEFVTVYPPGAQLTYAALWRVARDSVTGFKAAFVLAELLGGVLLLRLLQHFGQPPERVLIYLWSPLLVFEVAHAGHVDGLMLPFLIAALWARAKEHHGLLGLCLGAAAIIKFFPALLLPALLPLPRPWSWKGLRPALQTLLAFGGVTVLVYAPYVLDGAGILGFLPQYFDENFNLGLARVVFDFARRYGLPRSTLANALTFGGLALLSALFVIRPAASARDALIRCVWLIGWFTLTTQNLFAWYLLWLLPLLAVFLEPGWLFGLKLAPMSAWLVFTGTAAFSYLFFVRWRVIPAAQNAEYWPLYALLIVPLLARLFASLSKGVKHWRASLRTNRAPSPDAL